MIGEKISCQVIFTMDCERAHANKQFYPPGPHTWEESEENIEAFSRVLAEEGFHATFFAVPEAAEAHSELFNQLAKSGHEIGLHLHPRSFGFGVNEFLGNLPVEIQNHLLASAKQRFENSLGFSPVSFRGGYFSASQNTFSILSQLGFSFTSTTVPRRNNSSSGANWPDWRCLPYKNSGLWEIPVSSHPWKNLPDPAFELRELFRKTFSRRNYTRNQFGKSAISHAISLAAMGLNRNSSKINGERESVSPQYLQIEHRDLFILKNITSEHIKHWRRLKLTHSILVCTTHNDVPFSDSRGRHIKILKKYCQYLHSLSDLIINSATIKSLPLELFGSKAVSTL